jgi:hypothetical protein
MIVVPTECEYGAWTAVTPPRNIHLHAERSYTPATATIYSMHTCFLILLKCRRARYSNDDV